MQGEKGDWIETFTGTKIYPLSPNIKDIHIEDIAHALSLICRYNGHCSSYYSVAQHSVYVSDIVAPEFALQGLLHDAAEAYIGDVPRPIKKMIPMFGDIERVCMSTISRKYSLPQAFDESIWVADNIMLATEVSSFGMNLDKDWNLKEKPCDIVIEYWDPETAEDNFLYKFNSLRHFIHVAFDAC
jgi:hypothetical protein